MNRFDRILGILLYLRSGKSVSASQLAERFEVSSRTIYRDMEALSSLGVPVYAERGREGGFQLLEGYFLPPLMFSTTEAISLLLGVAFLHNLKAKPFEAELETAEQKLLVAMPDRLRTILEDARRIIGFEDITHDAFHPEPDLASVNANSRLSRSKIVSIFLQAILNGKTVEIQYLSPYRQNATTFKADPFGVFWDRDRWYLVGKQHGREDSPRFWRADRVFKVWPAGPLESSHPEFDVQRLLGHNWLKAAMATWSRSAPVKIRVTSAQAERLRQDWYYRHAAYQPLDDGCFLMTFGEDNCEIVLELLRWLGPGAELIEPEKWRQAVRDELRQMLATYDENYCKK